MKQKTRLIGIRGQFLWLMGAVIVFVTASTAVLGAQAQRDSLIQERTLRGLSVLRSWSSLGRERLLSDETVNLAMWDYVDDLMKNETAVEEVFLLDTTGQILMHNDQSKLGTALPKEQMQELIQRSTHAQMQERSHDGQQLRFAQDIVVSGKRLGYASIVFSSQGIEDGIQESVRKMLLVAGLIGLVSLGFAALLVYQVLRPIRLLAQGVKRFGESFDPQNPDSANIQVDFRTMNELGDLRDSFVEMTQALRKTMSERQALKEETGVLRIQATTDGMTGLLNKRQFEEDYPELVQSAVKLGRPFCVLMMDMDRFKQLNDTLGHAAGDQALKDLADSIRERVRVTDRAYRLGGDEFMLLSSGTRLEQARALAERVSQEYEKRKDPANPTSISFGIVEHDGVMSAHDLLKVADEEMYRVKREKKAAR